MAQVYFVRESGIGKCPATWGLWRVGRGPGRGEGTGFKTKAEARQFAKDYGHSIVPTSKGVQRVSRAPELA